eukprot:jgi/Bigna1/57672/fgenesh1_pm.24_\
MVLPLPPQLIIFALAAFAAAHTLGFLPKSLSPKALVLALLTVYKAFHRFQLRMRGITEDDVAYRRVVTGQSWEEFCDTLKAAGTAVIGHNSPKDPLNQAEGYRYLARLTRVALENFLECADPLSPQLVALANGNRQCRVCIGSDNPDNLYQNAVIDSRRTYRVRGSRGTVNYLGFGVQSGSYGAPGGLRTVDYKEASELKMQPHAKGKDAALDAGLSKAGLLVAGASNMFSRWASGFKSNHVNKLPLFDQKTSDSVGGDPNIRYYHSYWEIGEDEALVIDAKPPKCQTWNFQLNNHWMESLDYRFHNIHTNKFLARYRKDGSVRVIVSHSEEGFNWLSTVGHHCGTMCWRWVKPEVPDAALPHPTAKLVRFSQLAVME